MHTQETTAVGRSPILLAILTPLQKHPKLDAQGVFDLLPSHIFLEESLLVCRTKIAISKGKATKERGQRPTICKNEAVLVGELTSTGHDAK